jgi:hypothetical protein
MAKTGFTLVPRTSNLPPEFQEGIDRSPPEEGSREAVTGIYGPEEQVLEKAAGDFHYYFQTNQMQRLAVGCLYLLTGRAMLHFPGTARDGPSKRVMVDRNASEPLFPGQRGYFPFYVPWNKWNKAVVPVLQDPNFDMSLPKNKSLLRTDPGRLIKYLGDALTETFRQERFIP